MQLTKGKLRREGTGAYVTLKGNREIKRAQGEKPLAVLPQAAPRL